MVCWLAGARLSAAWGNDRWGPRGGAGWFCRIRVYDYGLTVCMIASPVFTWKMSSFPTDGTTSLLLPKYYDWLFLRLENIGCNIILHSTKETYTRHTLFLRACLLITLGIHRRRLRPHKAQVHIFSIERGHMCILKIDEHHRQV